MQQPNDPYFQQQQLNQSNNPQQIMSQQPSQNTNPMHRYDILV